MAGTWVIGGIKHHDIGEAFPQSSGLNTSNTVRRHQCQGSTPTTLLQFSCCGGESGASGMLTTSPGDLNVQLGLGTSALQA